jgi:hypothetical protein
MSLISDTNAQMFIAGSGDLVSLNSDALGYKFVNSATGTDKGTQALSLSGLILSRTD